MMYVINIFDDQQAPFLILENAHHQYSLWPALQALPDGWRKVFGPGDQAACFSWLADQDESLMPHCFTHEGK